jgi:hypothetical protein
MQRGCAAHDLELTPEAFVYLVQEHDIAAERTMRCCHPCRIVDQIHDLATCFGVRPALSEKLIDAAYDGYLADL